jgi:hypothetical protein
METERRQRKLIECKPWRATFERSNPSGDGYHTIIVIADTVQEALLAVGMHLPKTDCVLTSLTQMEAVRGVIV